MGKEVIGKIITGDVTKKVKVIRKITRTRGMAVAIAAEINTTKAEKSIGRIGAI